MIFAINPCTSLQAKPSDSEHAHIFYDEIKQEETFGYAVSMGRN